MTISELEFRFQGLYQSDLYVSLIKSLYKDLFVEDQKSTSYLYEDDMRKIVFENGEEIYTKKKSIKYKKYDGYKFEYAIETPIEPFGGKAQRIRKRVRSIYKLEKGLELHISKINDKYNEIEIEKEFDDHQVTDEDIESFYGLAEPYINVFESHFEAFFNFINLFNPKGSKTIPGTLDEGVIAKARDINKKDFANVNGKGLMEGYTVTIKGNGVPHLLFSSGRNLYLVSPRRYFHLLEPYRGEKFIILGEYFEELKMFTPFDILYTDRKKAIRYHPNHLERMDYVKDIFENINMKEMILFWKPFVPIGKTVKQMEKAFKYVNSKEYPFTDDGLILTPIFAPHNSKRDFKETSISEVPEILKVKPPHEQSFDVRVNLDTKQVFINRQREEYTGTKKMPFHQDNVLWNTIPTEAHMKIVELLPVKDESKWVMKFGRIREDRTEPNGARTVNDIWFRINNPMDPDFFMNQGVPRLSAQNNRIKRKLLDQIPQDCIVVDLGTGKGGDLGKYGKAKHVLCVEPDEINRKELIQRIRDMNGVHKFHVIACGAQDTEIIINKLKEIRQKCPECPVIVSSMLSMTFFWKNKKFLDMFKNTLHEVAKESYGAEFYFFTVNGPDFLKYLQEKDGKINLPGFKTKYDPSSKYGVGIPGRVRIAIKGTIVRDQEEYLVDLRDLDDVLENMITYNGKIEDFLTENEARMAAASIYGHAKIR